jgi:pimeloyl-ACP methyl ester carboxylesterase
VPADSSNSLPIVLVPGLNCSARLYAEQIPALWRFGPVMVADHTRDTSIAAIARRILAAAPPLFALAGLSMGAISPLRSCGRRRSGF